MAHKLADEAEFLLETYRLRLTVTILTLRELTSSETGFKEVITLLSAIQDENENALRRLKSARESSSAIDIIFASVWNIAIMKSLYHPVLAHAVSEPNALDRWSAKLPEILAKHNLAIMGEDRPRYVSMLSYGLLIKDHVFAIKALLLESKSSAAHARMTEMISWLNREQPTLQTAAQQRPADFPRTTDLILKQEKMQLPICDRGDADTADLFVTRNQVIVHTKGKNFYSKGQVEVGDVAKVEFEEGDDDRTFHVLGIGFRKVFTTSSQTSRDDWFSLFNEIKNTDFKIALGA